MTDTSDSASLALPSLEGDPCAYDEPIYLTERFVLVTLIGTVIAVVSAVENSFLSFLLLRSRHRSSHLLYLGLLAVCDVFIALSYIPLMSANLLADMLRSATLLKAWFHYMVPMITISHIAMTASSFLIVTATFERYTLTVSPDKAKFLHRNRMSIAAAALLLGLLTKMTMAFELNISHNEECASLMTEYSLSHSSLAKNPLYDSLWRFFARNLVTVYLPFVLLALMNIRIVTVISGRGREVDDNHARRKRVREATMTMIMVVFVYLLSNTLNVIVTIWEYIDAERLQVQYEGFYMFSVDIVSLLTVLGGTLRLPIYLICQSQLRRDFACVVSRIVKGGEKAYQTAPRDEEKKELHNDDDSSSRLLSPLPFPAFPLPPSP